MGSYVAKVQVGTNSTPISIGDTLYGICNTSASAATKEIGTITSTDFPDLDRMMQGIFIRIKFIAGNTVENNVRLVINNAGTFDVIGDCTCEANGIIGFTYEEGATASSDCLRVTSGGVNQSTRDYINSITSGALSAVEGMVFKGTLGSPQQSPTPNYTAVPNGSGTTQIYKAGYTYKIVTAGQYAGINCEVGDLLIAIENSTSGQNTINNAHWTVAQGNLDGAVTGPATAANETHAGHIAVFSDQYGRVLTDTGYTIATSVPANAVFTDENTSYQYSLNGGTAVNAVTAGTTSDSGATVLVSVNNGTLILAKGLSFTTASVMPSTASLTESAVAGPTL